MYDQNADLVLTDTNRRRARRWGTLRENNGYTEMAGETPLRYDPGDQRLALFPGAGDNAYTVTEQRGGATLRATGYGNPVTLTANDRADLAMDGDPLTAWRVGAVDDPIGQRLVIDLAQPTTTDHLTLLQPQTLLRNRWITKARLHFSDGTSADVDLDESSRVGAGQTVTFPEHTFDGVQIEILQTDIGKRPRYDGFSSVGFAEVAIPGVQPVEELVRPPTDLLDSAGTSSLDHRLALLFTRLRSNPAEPVRTDEETAIRRVFDLPDGPNLLAECAGTVVGLHPRRSHRPVARVSRCRARRHHGVVADPAVGQPRAAGPRRDRRRPLDVLGDHVRPTRGPPHRHHRGRSPPPSITSTCRS